MPKTKSEDSQAAPEKKVSLLDAAIRDYVRKNLSLSARYAAGVLTVKLYDCSDPNSPAMISTACTSIVVDIKR